jgi:hypothetical protein
MSEAAASLVAHAAFWALLVVGWTTGALDAVRGGVMLALWVIGAIALPHAPYEPAHAMFSSYVAVLDIALVFMVARGDIRLS